MKLINMKRRLLLWSGLTLLMIAVIPWLVHQKQNEVLKITVAVIEETPAERRASLSKNVKKVMAYSDEASLLNALDDGNVDAVLTNSLTGLAAIKTGEYSDLKLAGNLMEPESTAVVFHKEDNALRQAINEGLKKIIDNGTYALISLSYFGLNILTQYEFNDDQLSETRATDDSWLRIQQSGEINVALYDNNWPFSYFNDDDELTGFNVDIAKSVCRELGITFTSIVYPRDDIIEGLKNRYYECIWSSIPVTNSGDKDICFSNPYYISGLQFIVKRGSKIKNLF